MYVQRSSLERTFLEPSFTKLEHCSPMAGIDLEFPLPLSIRSKNLCGWGIKGYVIDIIYIKFFIHYYINIYYNLIQIY